MSKKKISKSVLKKLTKLLFLLLSWKENLKKKMFFFKKLQLKLTNCWQISMFKRKGLKSRKIKSQLPLSLVLLKLIPLLLKKLPLWKILKLLCPLLKLPSLLLIILILKIFKKWKPITNLHLSWNIS